MTHYERLISEIKIRILECFLDKKIRKKYAAKFYELQFQMDKSLYGKLKKLLHQIERGE